jgi:hypothetical protein
MGLLNIKQTVLHFLVKNKQTQVVRAICPWQLGKDFIDSQNKLPAALFLLS